MKKENLINSLNTCIVKMNTNSFFYPPTLLLELPEKGVYFFHSSEVVFLIHSFLHPWTAAPSARTVAERGVQDRFTFFRGGAAAEQLSYHESSRSPSMHCELCTRSPFLGTLVQWTLSENQMPAVQARSLCEWLRQSKCHTERGSSEAATAEPTGQKQSLSSSGLEEIWSEPQTMFCCFFPL